MPGWLRPAFGRPCSRRTAGSPPSPGRPGCRARRSIPTATQAASTTSGCGARWRSSRPGSSSTGRRSDDPGLYPSDHFGLSAQLRARPASRRVTRTAERWPAGRSAWPTVATTGCTPRTAWRDARGDGRRRAAMGSSSTCGLSLDGVPILLHDASLERVQGVDARAGDLTALELAGHGIPTLAEVLERVPRRAFLDVELKADLGRAVVEVLAAGRGADLQRAVVSSFEVAAIERVRGLAPAWPCWLNRDTLRPGDVRLARELGCVGLSVDWHAIDASRARAGLGGSISRSPPGPSAIPGSPDGWRRPASSRCASKDAPSRTDPGCATGRSAWRRRPYPRLGESPDDRRH